jgi:CheY-like chemotaxis protein
VGGRLDLIVTDFQMPGGDGLTFANAVRQSFPAIPIVIVSGHAKPSPVFPFLEKPFGWAALASTVHKLMASPAKSA